MEEEITIDLRDIFWILRKRIKLIALITVICTVVSGIASFYVLEPVYEAKTSIVIGKEINSTSDKYDNNDVVMYQKLIKTYVEIAKANDVAIEAVKRINSNLSDEEILEEATKWQQSSTISEQANTQILDIKITDKNPEKAKEKVDALTDSFMEAAKKIYPDGNIVIIDSAKVPISPVKPNKTLNVAIAFVLGLMISIGIAFLQEYLDNTVKSQEELEKLLDIPVIGSIPNYSAD